MNMKPACRVASTVSRSAGERLTPSACGSPPARVPARWRFWSTWTTWRRRRRRRSVWKSTTRDDENKLLRRNVAPFCSCCRNFVFNTRINFFHHGLVFQSMFAWVQWASANKVTARKSTFPKKLWTNTTRSPNCLQEIRRNYINVLRLQEINKNIISYVISKLLQYKRQVQFLIIICPLLIPSQPGGLRVKAITFYRL